MTTVDVVACVNGCTRRHADGDRHQVRVDLPRLVCDRCVDRLDTWLREISDYHERLQDMLQFGSFDGESRHGRRIAAAAPMRLDILDLLDDRHGHRIGGEPAEDRHGAIGALEPWTRLIAEQRHVPPPVAEVELLAGYLLRHLMWIVEQPWVDDFTAEIRRLHRELAAAVGIQPPLPVGRCSVVDADGNVCRGPLWPDRVGGVVCGSCGDRWSSATLARLGAGLPIGVAS